MTGNPEVIGPRISTDKRACVYRSLPVGSGHIQTPISRHYATRQELFLTTPFLGSFQMAKSSRLIAVQRRSGCFREPV